MNVRKRDGGEFRNRIFKYLHKNDTLQEINDRKGNPVYLNLTKRILLNRPYRNEEYEKERIRLMNKVNEQAEQNFKTQVEGE